MERVFINTLSVGRLLNFLLRYHEKSLCCNFLQRLVTVSFLQFYHYFYCIFPELQILTNPVNLFIASYLMSFMKWDQAGFKGEKKDQKRDC